VKISDLPSQYKPADVEASIYKFWLGEKLFHAEPNKNVKPYCIVIPPPNVTAALHLGHALNNTLQDILIRYHRMLGDNTVWIPGTDHAGIATQTVVEKRVLKEEGKRRTDFKREEFVARIQAWKDEYESRILSQLKAMGCSCDWDRTRFTMDDICARAVREAFFKLFQDGLIYRGKRLVNWDPATGTALADDEVEMQEIDGFFWYLKYPLVEPVTIEGKKVDHVTVATTRPETMLGDTAVAINPRDPRAPFLKGKKVRLPIVNREIPIVEDDYVVLPDVNSEDAKAQFATGFLKVTPAHDPNDWEIGKRHNLPVINILAPDATISDKHGWTDLGDADDDELNLIGMDRYEAREAIVEWFKKNHLLEEVKPYRHSVGHSYRSHVPIEPYLSDQWYVKVTDERMAGAALRAMADEQYDKASGCGRMRRKQGKEWEGTLKFFPERYAKTFQTWHENIRDWCISRQLWWGHRIPVWRMEVPDGFDKAGLQARLSQDTVIQSNGSNVYVCVRDAVKQTADVAILEKAGFEQDPDVLDTWFSSALWPFSTLGWPEMTKELDAWNPGDTLGTAREIITLWVSRMVMMNLYMLERLPFKNVYIHAMLQDGQGRKMSKSLGNGVDPLDIIEKYGSDAMRYSLAYLTTGTQDIRMPVKKEKLENGKEINTSERFEIGRNLANKLWNAARFAMMNLEDAQAPTPLKVSSLVREDRWIISRLNQTIEQITNHIKKFEFAESVSVIYRFFWNDFCDWYLEWIKPRMRQGGETKKQAQQVLAFALDQILRVLHPTMPYITEQLWQYLNGICPNRMLDQSLVCNKPLVVSPWPVTDAARNDQAVEQEIEVLQNLIRASRDVRTTVNCIRSANKEKSLIKLPQAILRGPKPLIDLIGGAAEVVCDLGYIETLKIDSEGAIPSGSSVKVVTDHAGRNAELIIPLADLIDISQERARIEKELKELAGHIQRSEERLANQNFVSKAPPKVLEEHRQKLDELKSRRESLTLALAEFK
jgi:valyl-tRNA synthetase